MKVINKTKEVILHHDVREAKTREEKMRGLLDALSTDAMLFDTRWGIHTFGMKFPIDCLICDDNGFVRAIKKNLEPEKFFFWNPRFKKVIELPGGTVEKTGTILGEQIQCE